MNQPHEHTVTGQPEAGPVLPPIRDVRRVTVRPGSALIVRVGETGRRLSQQLAHDLEALVRRRLDLPDEVGVLIIGSDMQVAVVTPQAGTLPQDRVELAIPWPEED